MNTNGIWKRHNIDIVIGLLVNLTSDINLTRTWELHRSTIHQRQTIMASRQLRSDCAWFGYVCFYNIIIFLINCFILKYFINRHVLIEIINLKTDSVLLSYIILEFSLPVRILGRCKLQSCAITVLEKYRQIIIIGLYTLITDFYLVITFLT